MQFGICINMQATDPHGIGLERLRHSKEAGAEYLEMPLAQMSALDDKAFHDRLLPALDASGLPCYSCNNFFPASYRLTGPTADHRAALFYAKTALARAKTLGAKRVVFGSSGARNLPDGFAHAEGTSQLRSLLRDLAPLAQDAGIVIAIEPLNLSESNILNTLAEATELVRAVDHPAVTALVDFYHLRMVAESCDAIVGAGPLLTHAHIARTLGREMPVCDGEEPYLPFFRALKRIGYTGNLSLEANTPPNLFVERSRQAIALMKRLWEQA